jgi:hypothetical protein
MLAVTHSEFCYVITAFHATLNSEQLFIYLPALPTLIFAKYNFPRIVLNFFLNLRGKIEKIMYYTHFISHFVTLVYFTALVAALLVF